MTDSSPSNESAYSARFYLAPNGVTLPNTKPVTIFTARTSGGVDALLVQLQKTASGYQVRAQARSGTNYTATSWYTISNTSHPIEIGWQAASTTNGTNGFFKIWIDGTLRQTRSGLRNGSLRVEEARLGPSSGMLSTMSGAEYFDAFVSTKGTYIGP